MDEHDLDVYFVSTSSENKNQTFKFMNEVRNSGLSSDMDFCNRSVKSQIKTANRWGALYTVIVGGELEQGYVVVKDMFDTRIQENVACDFLVKYLKLGISGILIHSLALLANLFKFSKITSLCLVVASKCLSVSKFFIS